MRFYDLFYNLIGLVDFHQFSALNGGMGVSGGCPKLFHVELEHKVRHLIKWKYISFQNVTHKGNCVSGQYLLKLREGDLTANLHICNRKVNINSEIFFKTNTKHGSIAPGYKKKLSYL